MVIPLTRFETTAAHILASCNLRSTADSRLCFRFLNFSRHSFSFQISLPRANEGDITLEVDIYLTYLVQSPGGGINWTNPKNYNITLQRGNVELDMSQNIATIHFKDGVPQEARQINRLEVKASYTRPDGKEYQKEEYLYNIITGSESQLWRI